MDISPTADSRGRTRQPTPASHRDWTFCAWLLLASLLLHIGMVLLTRQHESVPTLDGDEREYWNLSSDFQAQGPAGITARRTLPYPLLIAVLRWTVGDDYLHVQLALSTLLSVVPVLVYWLVRRRIADDWVARLAAVGCLLWPAFVRYDATLYSDPTGVAVFLCFLVAFPLNNVAAAASGRRWLHFFVAGALLSVAIQFKPLYLIFIPFALALAFFSERSGPGNRLIGARRVLAVCWLSAGCIALLLPWSAYISSREGRFIPVSANGGETLAGGLNPQLMLMDKNAEFVTADGRTWWIGPGKWLLPEETGYITSEERQLPYVKLGALLNARTKAWIMAHPAQAAYLSMRKLLYMWGFYPFWNGLSQTVLGNLPLIVLLAAASASLWINRSMFTELAIFWSLPLFVSAVALISWGSWRFRLPADIGLIVLTAMLPAASLRRRSAMKT